MFYEHKPSLENAKPVAPRRLQVTMAITLDAFENLRSGWKTLETIDPNATVFLSWSWMRRIMRDNPDAWRVLVVSDLAQNGQVVGLLPVGLKKGEAFGASGLLGAEYGALLCHPDYEAAVLPLLAKAVQTLDWTTLRVSGNGAQGRMRKFMAGFSSNAFRTASLQKDSVQIVLPDSAEAYLKDLEDASVAEHLVAMRKRRAWRSYVSEPEDVATDLDFLTDMMLAEGASNEALVAMRALLVNAQHSDALFLVTLRDADGPIGVLAHILDHDLDRVHVVGFAAAQGVDRTDVRAKLHLDCVSWAIRHGFAVYDLGQDDAAARYANSILNTSGAQIVRRG